MPDWFLFAGITIVVTVGFVLLARASARVLTSTLAARDDPLADRQPADSLLSSRAIAGNVLASHGLLAALLLGTAWYAAVPVEALGLHTLSVDHLALGVALGVALAGANAAGVRLAARTGLHRDERLRALLAPDTQLGWAGLLVVVLPLVAFAEELLFRGAFIGALEAGLGLPVWGLVAVSSVLFGFGHGLQGPAGVVVTAGLGAALAAAFVVTGSLAAVVVAHYLVNAIELVVNEGPVAGRWGR